MTDMLIRDVPDDVISAVDANAKRQGLSRSEFVRRLLAQQKALADHRPVTVEDFRRFREALPDLGDPEIMRGASE